MFKRMVQLLTKDERGNNIVGDGIIIALVLTLALGGGYYLLNKTGTKMKAMGTCIDNPNDATCPKQ